MTLVPTAILLLARLPAETTALREFEDLANTQAARWHQIVIPCPVAGADDVLFAVRSALARGVERVVALPLLVPIVALREWKVAEQFRVLGRRFTSITFHMAQVFGPTDAARALAESVREWTGAAPARQTEATAVILVGGEKWAPELAGLARLTFEFGAGVAVDYAVGTDLSSVLERQSRLGVRHVVVAAGELFTAGLVEQQAGSLPTVGPYWRRETVLRQFEDRWQTALKDQSLVPQVWDEVARELHPVGDLLPEEEETLLRQLNDQIALLPPPDATPQGGLLQPALPEAIAAAPEAYRTVLEQIERGLQTVTGRPTVSSKAPGWVGVSCETEEMAVWLLRAVIVENVMVRREGSTLYLPAGPNFHNGEVRRLVGVVGRAARYCAHIAQRPVRTCS